MAGKVQNGLHQPSVRGSMASIRQGKFRSQLTGIMAHVAEAVKILDAIFSGQDECLIALKGNISGLTAVVIGRVC
jgi:hypothetical protein